MNNYEKIKQMSLEDLAILLDEKSCNRCKFYYDNINDDKIKCDLRKCRCYIKQWLESEAKDDL